MTQEAFGRPITGEVSHYTTTVEQQDPQLWVDSLDALLDLASVKSVKWRQYTPYFNDGEPCTFTAYGVSVLLEGIEPDEEGDGFGDYSDNYVDAWSLKYSQPDLEKAGVTVDISELGELNMRLQRFATATEGGAHYTMLNTTFGDPAVVVADASGFSVEYYEHD